MTTNKLFKSVVSFDDIVFTNRNHAYGAYYLRKRYNKHLFVAFLVSFSLIAGAIIGPHLYSTRKSAVGYIPHDETIVFDPSEMPPPPPPPPAPEPKLGKIAFVPPKIVDTAILEDLIKPVDEYINEQVNTPPPKDLVAYNPPSRQKEINDDMPVLWVEESATFLGGDLNNFRKWVSEHIVYPEIATGNMIDGKVILQFVVGKKGSVEDIKLLRGVDPVLDQEAIRVLKSSPEWKPGKQGGKEVRQQFSLPITFKLTR